MVIYRLLIYLTISTNASLKVCRAQKKSELIKTQIDSEVVNVCNATNTCENSNGVHCHLISNTAVSTAVSKLKTDKVNDNGMIYSNNFIHETELLFQYLVFFYTR